MPDPRQEAAGPDAPRAGRVASFDTDAGYGEVEDRDGRRHWFHCTAVTDGSRRVDVGAPVLFELVPGRSGRWEAARVHPLEVSPRPPGS